MLRAARERESESEGSTAQKIKRHTRFWFFKCFIYGGVVRKERGGLSKKAKTNQQRETHPSASSLNTLVRPSVIQARSVFYPTRQEEKQKKKSPTTHTKHAHPARYSLGRDFRRRLKSDSQSQRRGPTRDAVYGRSAHRRHTYSNLTRRQHKPTSHRLAAASLGTSLGTSLARSSCRRRRVCTRR